MQVTNLQDPKDCIRGVVIKCYKCLALPIPMQTAEDAVEAAGELVVVKEAMTDVPMQPFQEKHPEVGACKDLEGHIFTIVS